MPLNSPIPIRKDEHFYLKKIWYQLNRSEGDFLTRGQKLKIFSRSQQQMESTSNLQYRNMAVLRVI